MQQFAALLIAFLSIPVLIKATKKKMPIGIAIIICAVLLVFITYFDFTFTAPLTALATVGVQLWDIFSETFLNWTKIQQLIVVLEVSTLGALLKKYQIIDQALACMQGIVRSKRIQLMLIPAIVGLLSVPGGAIFSAPFIDDLGEQAGVPKTRRAILNLVYRHLAMFLMPYANGLLLVMALTNNGINIYHLISLNLIFVLLYVSLGYFLYLRQVPRPEKTPRSHFGQHLWGLVRYTSPIYLSVLLNLILGVPFYLGMIANYLAVLLLAPRKTFLADILHSINFNVLYAIIGVYFIQGIIDRMDVVLALFTGAFQNPATLFVGIVVASFFFGLITGFQLTAIGVVVPILMEMSLAYPALLFYIFMTCICGFIGYFFSPLHLCQLFTCEYMGVSTKELYKQYAPFFAGLAVIVVLLYFVVGTFLL